MTKAKLTPTPQGHNDVYWCQIGNRAIVIASSGCPTCLREPGSAAFDARHQFLAHAHLGDDVKNEVYALAEVVRGTDEAEAEIEILREAISKFAQQVHQAYHGAHPPDLCDVNHLECPRGLCRSVQHVLDPRRQRGMP